MEYTISLFIFIFGIITWIPFLKTPYGQDQAGNAYLADQVLKKKIALFKDKTVYTIGHFLHVIVLQYLFGKDNKYCNWFMCLWCSLSAVIVYWIVYNLFGLTSAIIAGVLFALYIVNPRIGGNWGPIESLLALPSLASLLLIIQASKTDSYLLIALSGMFFGYAILIKQTTILYLPGYLLMMIGRDISLTSYLIFGGSAFLTNLIPLLYYWKKNAFWEYLACNWLVMIPSAVNPKKYNKLYPKMMVRGEMDNKTKKHVLLNNSLSLFPVLFVTTISSISFIVNYNFSIFYLGLFACLLASIWMIFMRGTLFPHYWLYMIPWLVILASYSLGEIVSNLHTGSNLNTLQLSGISAICGVFLFAIIVDYKFYIPHRDPYGFLRKFYGDNFVNANYKGTIDIGKYIKKTTNPDDKILVCGWAPYIILYSERSSFCPDFCLYAEDYLEIYNKSNPALLDFLNSIFKFNNFKIIKQKENLFKTGFPEIIVFADGKGDIKDFEKLTGIYYSKDEHMRGYPLYRADRELTELMSPYDKTSNVEKNEEVKLERNESFESSEKQDWNTALKTAKQLLKKDPQNIEHLSILGDCLMGLGNYKLLFRFYNRLIENKIVPTTSRLELLNKLGEAYCSLNKFKDAEALFHKILILNHNNSTVLNNLGFVYSKQNESRKASECFRKTLELDPNNEDAIFNLDQIKAQCS
ncbi:MAG: Tetratricopeptide repeat protein [Candidatus Scalindua rubra]|uniref:Tetratricopeptide repeat protein n=1 Tax=Candidatus Scalindua rubra TaxID=1872076 RepID=A0A1E3XB41_9BACT|nr:MAG: Tetratricopeptide repeat protein [Candidatus Scalindua rubra]